MSHWSPHALTFESPMNRLLPPFFLVLGLVGAAAVARAEPLSFEVEYVTYSQFGDKAETRAEVTLKPIGTDANAIRATRVTLTQAKDDQGRALRFSQVPVWVYKPAGSVPGADLIDDPSFIVLPIENGVTALKSVAGTVDVVLWGRDSSSRVSTDLTVTPFGSLLNSGALTAAGISITLLNRPLAQRIQATAASAGQTHVPGEIRTPRCSLNHYVPAGSTPGSSPATSLFPTLAYQNFLTDNDIAVGVSDPELRFLGIEFESRDGTPLDYNHDAVSHSGMGGYHSEVYQLRGPIPFDMKIVVWIRTDKSTTTVPFEFASIPLPKRPADTKK